MQYPLVTIICISYNHSKYLIDAIESVWKLDYSNVQLIIADDSSSDNSQQIIKDLVGDKEVELVLNSTNIGHCKTFNKALKLAKGEFIIDLSADDVLKKDSLNLGIDSFKEMGIDYGVFFADAEHIDENGVIIGSHLTNSFFYLGAVPQGDIYRALLSKFFISPPTMIFRKEIMDKLEGYNEKLSYEDFDFLVRSSRISKFCYSTKITIQKRLHSKAASLQQYVKNSSQLNSTLEICKTAYRLNISKMEDIALLKRLAYEAKMSVTSSNFSIAFQMFILAIKVLFKVR